MANGMLYNIYFKLSCLIRTLNSSNRSPRVTLFQKSIVDWFVTCSLAHVTVGPILSVCSLCCHFLNRFCIVFIEYFNKQKLALLEVIGTFGNGHVQLA